MDIEHFLKARTAFIRYFYENAIQRFIEIKIAIEHQEEPFVPPYSEDEEPAFLEDRMNAERSIETIGHVCISMLSSSLKLFLQEWVDRLRIDHGINFYVNFKKKGWFNGYKEIFENLKLPISNCGADLDVIEQITLARNRIQHPEILTTLRVIHSKKDLKKFPKPLFAKDSDLKMAMVIALHRPSVTSTKDNIFEAIRHVETLCSWAEEEYLKKRPYLSKYK